MLFAKKGFNGVTMTDICRKTGLSRGGLYRYYSGTASVFSDILSEEHKIAERIEKNESAEAILEDILETIKTEITDKELSLSLAIYEYADLGNEEFFAEVSNNAKKRWTRLINYGMETKVFKSVDAKRTADMILYYYQGLRMWSRIVPVGEEEAENYIETVRGILLK